MSVRETDRAARDRSKSLRKLVPPKLEEEEILRKIVVLYSVKDHN